MLVPLPGGVHISNIQLQIQKNSNKLALFFPVSHHVQRQGAGVQLHPAGSPEHTGGLPSVAALPDHRSPGLPGGCMPVLFTFTKQPATLIVIHAVVSAKVVIVFLFLFLFFIRLGDFYFIYLF